MIEEKDRPLELDKPLYEDVHGKTCGLWLLMREPARRSGKVIVLDSRFCVLKAMISRVSYSICSSSMTKKRRRWPKHTDSTACNAHFSSKLARYQDTTNGTCNNNPFCVVGLKEPEHNMLTMRAWIFGQT